MRKRFLCTLAFAAICLTTVAQSQTINYTDNGVVIGEKTISFPYDLKNVQSVLGGVPLCEVSGGAQICYFKDSGILTYKGSSGLENLVVYFLSDKIKPFGGRILCKDFVIDKDFSPNEALNVGFEDWEDGEYGLEWGDDDEYGLTLVFEGNKLAKVDLYYGD